MDGMTHATFELHFGCQTHLTGLFKTQLADGIAGMEMADTSLWKQAYTQGAIPRQVFSLCFTHDINVKREGTQAGIMTMGFSSQNHAQTLQHETPMVFANQPNGKGWFRVKIVAMYLRTNGGNSVMDSDGSTPDYHKVQASMSTLNNGEVIVDSGTTDTYLPSKLKDAFAQAWSDATGGTTYDHEPRSLTDEELNALPTILFELEGSNDDRNPCNKVPAPVETACASSRFDDSKQTNHILVAMPPNRYMEYSKKRKKYTSRIYLTEMRGGVLGANFMLGKDVLFDVENHVIGFAESSCDYSKI
mmetsp:Transcript_56/g.128  ORF Transcript_56/g.128 Transcript_56/m.128 type:complete len:303 (-) Transcript_56:137-1045(-)